MRDPYLYDGTDVLKNLLDIRDRKLLNEAESDYVVYPATLGSGTINQG